METLQYVPRAQFNFDRHCADTQAFWSWYRHIGKYRCDGRQTVQDMLRK